MRNNRADHRSIQPVRGTQHNPWAGQGKPPTRPTSSVFLVIQFPLSGNLPYPPINIGKDNGIIFPDFPQCFPAVFNGLLIRIEKTLPVDQRIFKNPERHQSFRKFRVRPASSAAFGKPHELCPRDRARPYLLTYPHVGDKKTASE